jgi:ubiquitin-protein ligase
MGMQSLVRVHKEVQDVNNDFHSLRTVLKETDNKFKWNFVMFPNDGALSHLPLIGELVIPQRYPNDPPVLHLFTRTRRWNVDVYQSYMRDDTHSTMCFNILRSKANGGIWESDYTISCLFASLMQALVTPRVPQEYGPDNLEFVSMEKLDDIKQQVHRTYLTHKDRIPRLPAMPTIPAASVPAHPFVFTRLGDQRMTKSLAFRGNDTYVSQAIYLQDPRKSRAWSTVLDLNNLHPGVVFSVILSNKPGTDHTGNKNDTILLRNGVTGTAAKKMADQKIVWFYHGKPLNDGNLSVCITVTNDQFTMSYKADGTGTDNFLVHGDTPISKLGRAQIGNVDRMPFYLSIFLKRKFGNEGFVNVLDQKGVGFTHQPVTPAEEATTAVPRNWHADPPIFVKLALDSEQTTRLQNVIDFYSLGLDFEIKRNIRVPAHQTLVYFRDLPRDQYADVVNDIYAPLQDKLIEVNVTAIVADGKCVALLTDAPRCSENGMEVPCYPQDKVPHLTMRLRDRSIKPVYSNVLAKRVTAGRESGQLHRWDTYVELPQPIKLLCPLKFHF